MVAVSVKQRIEACLSVFIKRAIPTAGIGRGSAPSGPRHTYDGKTISPGMIKEMNVGDEIQVVNPQGQATDAASYIKLQQRLIGAGQGISYEATARDMSEANYSSARQGLIEDSMTYAEEDELLADVLDEIYETFIISGSPGRGTEHPGLLEGQGSVFFPLLHQAPEGLDRPQQRNRGHKDGPADRPEDLQADRRRKRPGLEKAD